MIEHYRKKFTFLKKIIKKIFREEEILILGPGIVYIAKSWYHELKCVFRQLLTSQNIVKDIFLWFSNAFSSNFENPYNCISSNPIKNLIPSFPPLMIFFNNEANIICALTLDFIFLNIIGLYYPFCCPLLKNLNKL